MAGRFATGLLILLICIAALTHEASAASKSRSRTRSRTATPSRTPSKASMSRTPTRTSSRSLTASVSVSFVISASPSLSQSQAITISAATTESASLSASVSLVASALPTISSSGDGSSDDAVNESVDASVAVSGMVSAGPSPTATLIATPTRSTEPFDAVAKSSSTSYSAGQTAGIVIGVLFGTLALIAIVILLVSRRHKRRQQPRHTTRHTESFTRTAQTPSINAILNDSQTVMGSQHVVSAAVTSSDKQADTVDTTGKDLESKLPQQQIQVVSPAPSPQQSQPQPQPQSSSPSPPAVPTPSSSRKHRHRRRTESRLSDKPRKRKSGAMSVLKAVLLGSKSKPKPVTGDHTPRKSSPNRSSSPKVYRTKAPVGPPPPSSDDDPGVGTVIEARQEYAAEKMARDLRKLKVKRQLAANDAKAAAIASAQPISVWPQPQPHDNIATSPALQSNGGAFMPANAAMGSPVMYGQPPQVVAFAPSPPPSSPRLMAQAAMSYSPPPMYMSPPPPQPVMFPPQYSMPMPMPVPAVQQSQPQEPMVSLPVSVVQSLIANHKAAPHVLPPPPPPTEMDPWASVDYLSPESPRGMRSVAALPKRRTSPRMKRGSVSPRPAAVPSKAWQAQLQQADKSWFY